jgi:hypothetical protein
MPETANIARIAELVSQELFDVYLWNKTGPRNWNWPCEEQSNHRAPTHPSDVVFFYDEPYALARTYVNCDLKSYATGSINAASIRSAIESLARALTCAEKSDEWRTKFIHDHVSPEICGLLFVYNHDGAYDRNFRQLLNSVKNEKLDIPRKSKIVVLGPEDIYWLNNVRYEIVQLRGKGQLPDQENCRFFYPHLVRRKNVQLEHARAATLETLTSPWIILSYSNPKKQNQKGFLVFYRRHGDSTDEFLYLIDYLMHYQVLVDDTDVHVKTLQPHPSAHAYFKKAIDQYIDECDGTDDIRERLTSIQYSQINQVKTVFSELDIGMENA